MKADYYILKAETRPTKSKEKRRRKRLQNYRKRLFTDGPQYLLKADRKKGRKEGIFIKMYLERCD